MLFFLSLFIIPFIKKKYQCEKKFIRFKFISRRYPQNLASEKIIWKTGIVFCYRVLIR